MTSLFGDKAHARASPLLVHTNYARVLSQLALALSREIRFLMPHFDPKMSYYEASLGPPFKMGLLGE